MNNIFLKAFETNNPFAPVSSEVPSDAPEGSYTYQLVQSGPAVPVEECEIPVAAVEVMIRWGATVLHVAHLTPVRSFWVGEDPGKGQKCDLFLPAEKLGAPRLPLVLASEGAVLVVIPAGATGSIKLAGEPSMRVGDLIAAGAAAACTAADGAHQIALPAGARAALSVNGLSFEISAVNAGKRAGRFSLSGESLPYQGLSLLLHGALLAATALFVPSMAMADEEGISDQQRYVLAQMLAADAIREPEESKAPSADAARPGDHGSVGNAAPGEQGAAGSLTSRATNHRFGVEGHGPDTFLSKNEAIKQAQEFGMIGLLNSMNGSLGAPTSPFGQEIAGGTDPKSGNGNMFGQSIDDATGSGGLGLTGIGESGNGTGHDIGVGRIGTVGHDFMGGNGNSTWVPRRAHKADGPGAMRVGDTVAKGRLPPEVIQRVVRQNFGKFRACYESALRSNPSLQGRVGVRFVIGPDGAVSSAANGGSDLPDAGVVSCVTRAFYGISFPQPENGIVTVTYPIVFSPAN